MLHNTWIINPRSLPFSFIIGVLNFLSSQKSKLMKNCKGESSFKLFCVSPELNWHTLGFHGPLYAGLGTFGGFHTPFSSSSQLSGWSGKVNYEIFSYPIIFFVFFYLFYRLHITKCSIKHQTGKREMRREVERKAAFWNITSSTNYKRPSVGSNIIKCQALIHIHGFAYAWLLKQ